MAGIKRALISVSNKAGVVLLARELREMGVEIVSTGGTEKRLLEEGSGGHPHLRHHRF